MRFLDLDVTHVWLQYDTSKELKLGIWLESCPVLVTYSYLINLLFLITLISQICSIRLNYCAKTGPSDQKPFKGQAKWARSSKCLGPLHLQRILFSSLFDPSPNRVPDSEGKYIKPLKHPTILFSRKLNHNEGEELLNVKFVKRWKNKYRTKLGRNEEKRFFF